MRIFHWFCELKLINIIRAMIVRSIEITFFAKFIISHWWDSHNQFSFQKLTPKQKKFRFEIHTRMCDKLHVNPYFYANQWHSLFWLNPAWLLVSVKNSQYKIHIVRVSASSYFFLFHFTFIYVYFVVFFYINQPTTSTEYFNWTDTIGVGVSS